MIDVGCRYGDLLIYSKSRGAGVIGVDSSGTTAPVGGQIGLDIRCGTSFDAVDDNSQVNAAIFQCSLEHMESFPCQLAESS
jgi:hypothetical protein